MPKLKVFLQGLWTLVLIIVSFALALAATATLIIFIIRLFIKFLTVGWI